MKTAYLYIICNKTDCKHHTPERNTGVLNCLNSSASIKIPNPLSVEEFNIDMFMKCTSYEPRLKSVD